MRSILLSVFISVLVNVAFSQKTTSPDIIIIPVVVHIIYNNAEQNISNEQVRSQIAVLNNDYRKKNKDAGNIPQAFKSIAGDAHIEFRLATIDPAGFATNGIIRKSTDMAGFGIDDKIKFSLSGGDDAWNRDQYLNLWVGNISGGVMGYASAPGCAPEKDGVVIRYNVFGTTPNVQPPYNKGRTAVHEIGHWLGLRHIWGDSPCGNDQVDDTPPQQGPTRGCPSGVVISCGGNASGNMYMNFMDFTDDACMNMFTNGQVARMRELFYNDGARVALLSSGKAIGAQEADEAGLSESSSAVEIVMYPNPVVSVLNIQFNEDLSGGEQLVIYNRLGQVTKRVTVTKRLMNIDVAALKPGIYFISIGGKASGKFIKR